MTPQHNHSPAPRLENLVRDPTQTSIACGQPGQRRKTPSQKETCAATFPVLETCSSIRKTNKHARTVRRVDRLRSHNTPTPTSRHELRGSSSARWTASTRPGREEHQGDPSNQRRQLMRDIDYVTVWAWGRAIAEILDESLVRIEKQIAAVKAGNPGTGGGGCVRRSFQRSGAHERNGAQSVGRVVADFDKTPSNSFAPQ